MKIVSWNACCKFREKYKDIEALDADIYVIQECENPATCKDKSYCEFVKNGFWKGKYNYKGVMIFTTKENVKLEILDWGRDDKRYFIPVRVNDSFTIVASWACDPYCEELQDWVDVTINYLNEETIIIGDLNSNISLDPPHIKKANKSFGQVLDILKPKGIFDIWTHLKKEEGGKESVPTFYLYRHLDKPLHLDHCLASPKIVQSMTIHARWQWLALSDHLPIEVETI